MENDDLHLHPAKAGLAYVKDRFVDGTVGKDPLPSEVVKAVEANGHAFRDRD